MCCNCCFKIECNAGGRGRRRLRQLGLPATLDGPAGGARNAVVLQEAAVREVRDAGEEAVPGWAEGDACDLAEDINLQGSRPPRVDWVRPTPTCARSQKPMCVYERVCSVVCHDTSPCFSW